MSTLWLRSTTAIPLPVLLKRSPRIMQHLIRTENLDSLRSCSTTTATPDILVLPYILTIDVITLRRGTTTLTLMTTSRPFADSLRKFTATNTFSNILTIIMTIVTTPINSCI